MSSYYDLRSIRDRSSVSKLEYVWYHFLLGTNYGIVLYLRLSDICPIAQCHQNIFRLLACVLGSILLGVMVTFRYNREYHHIFGHTFAGLGLYILLTIGVYKALLVKCLIAICLVGTLINIALIFKLPIIHGDSNKEILHKKLRRSGLVIKNNLVVISCIACFVLPIAVHFTSETEIANTYGRITGCKEGTIVFDGNEYAVVEAYGDEYSLSNNIDTIKLIRDNDTFQSLSYERKCEVIEAVMNCEARYLGLCKINLQFEELDDHTGGDYDHETRTIRINSKPLKDGTMSGGSNDKVLRTILHETRHCYQRSLAELYRKASPEERNLFAFTNEDVASWLENYDNYITYDEGDGPDRYTEYYKQPVEMDARKWEVIEMLDYFRLIDEMTGEEE